MKVIIDIETLPIPHHLEGVHVIVTKEVHQGCKVWLEEHFEEFKEYARGVTTWIGHNAVGFDIPVVNHVLGLDLPTSWPGVVDTFVVSRLVNYQKYNTHSLDEIGQAMNFPKGKFYDFSTLTQEMIDYCIQDVKLTEKIYLMYRKWIEAEGWYDAMSIEHDTATICKDMSNIGFGFNTPKAKSLLESVTHRMATLEPIFQEQWPPWRIEDRRIKYRVNKDGSVNKRVAEVMATEGDWELDGGEVVVYKPKEFNPGSTKDRVDKLWECGWKPFMKTKTHMQFARVQVGDMWGKSKLTPELYREKREKFDRYGWVVNEENLQTLPESAPEGASLLAEWLTLEGRRSALQTWLHCVSEDSRIHGKFWSIGTWTHRMSHSDPNQANISAPFHGEPRNAVEQVKKQYDADMRSCWTTEDGVTLVGTDADGIQLRILAHYLKNDDYVHAIVEGNKELGTDIHNLNRKALSLDNITRDHAKKFIYAWLLGAQTARVASLLSCSTAEASVAMGSFVEKTHGLSSLKGGLIKRDAKRGYFDGLDGRKVKCNSEHLMLAGYLQNGEAIIMKRANRLWRQWADDAKILYGQVDFVHDEWQTECYGSQDMCEQLGHLQRKSIEITGIELGLYCPLAGSTDYGNNWLETH